MKLNLDLHIHSQRSPDGRMTLEEITAIARARGLDGVAVCDHDVVYKGPTELNGVLIIPGVECSTETGHLLGLFVTEPVPSRPFAKAARAIHEAGGITVMAHPFQHSRDEARLLPLCGELDGMEAWNGRANRKNPQANAMAQRFAEAHGLRPFAGSDAHLPGEIGNGVLTIEAEARTLPAVKAALLGGQGVFQGKEGQDRDVARSQYTKLRKTHAGPMRCGKWAAFAALCVWRDLRRNLSKAKGEKDYVTHR